MPKVSLIVPAYNHEKYIEQSVKSMLEQTFADFEIIISDDASSDATVEKIKSLADPRIKLIENSTNVGCAANSHRAFQLSSGEYLGWMGTDDIYEPHMVSLLVNFLDSHEDVLGVFGQATHIDENGFALDSGSPLNGVGKNRFEHLADIFKLQNFFCAPAGLIRRSAFTAVGYIPHNFKQLNDFAEWCRILFAGEIVILNDVLIRYRLRDNNQNISAWSTEVGARLVFESIQILNDFRKSVQDIHYLRKIFPEIACSELPLTDELKDFHLAQLALKENTAPHNFFALGVLHEMLGQPNLADLLSTQCNFGFNDFFELTGKRFDSDVLQNKFESLLEHLAASQRHARSQEETISTLVSEIERVNEKKRAALTTVELLKAEVSALREHSDVLERRVQKREAAIRDLEQQLLNR